MEGQGGGGYYKVTIGNRTPKIRSCGKRKQIKLLEILMVVKYGVRLLAHAEHKLFWLNYKNNREVITARQWRNKRTV